MTAQQCAERQAARDNLVRELCEVLEAAREELKLYAEELDGEDYNNPRINEVLRRAKEQQ